MEKKEERGKEIPTFFPPLFSTFFFANGSIYHSFFPFFLLRFQPPPQKKEGEVPALFVPPLLVKWIRESPCERRKKFAGRNTPLFSLSPRPAYSRMLAQFSQVLGFPNLFFFDPHLAFSDFFFLRGMMKNSPPGSLIGRGGGGRENEEGGAD